MAGRNPAAYSRFVGYLKIALPLVAIGLLSTVFLVRQEKVLSEGITFSEMDRDTMRDGLAIYNPKFSGSTVKGDRYFWQAEKAIPDGADPKVVSMSGLDGRTDFVNGRTLFLKSAHGVVYLPEQRIVLTGGVQFSTDDGFRGMTNAATAELDAGAFVSAGPITVEGPLGRLEAGSLTVETLTDPNDPTRENQMYRFEKGVKLVLTPK